MAQSGKVNGTGFIRVKLLIASDKRPTGWTEAHAPGIPPDTAYGWALRLIAKRNESSGEPPHRLVSVGIVGGPS